MCKENLTKKGLQVNNEAAMQPGIRARDVNQIPPAGPKLTVEKKAELKALSLERPEVEAAAMRHNRAHNNPALAHPDVDLQFIYRAYEQGEYFVIQVPSLTARGLLDKAFTVVEAMNFPTTPYAEVYEQWAVALQTEMSRRILTVVGTPPGTVPTLGGVETTFTEVAAFIPAYPGQAKKAGIGLEIEHYKKATGILSNWTTRISPVTTLMFKSYLDEKLHGYQDAADVDLLDTTDPSGKLKSLSEDQSLYSASETAVSDRFNRDNSLLAGNNTITTGVSSLDRLLANIESLAEQVKERAIARFPKQESEPFQPFTSTMARNTLNHDPKFRRLPEYQKLLILAHFANTSTPPNYEPLPILNYETKDRGDIVAPAICTAVGLIPAASETADGPTKASSIRSPDLSDVAAAVPDRSDAIAGEDEESSNSIKANIEPSDTVGMEKLNSIDDTTATANSSNDKLHEAEVAAGANVPAQNPSSIGATPKGEGILAEYERDRQKSEEFAALPGQGGSTGPATSDPVAPDGNSESTAQLSPLQMQQFKILVGVLDDPSIPNETRQAYDDAKWATGTPTATVKVVKGSLPVLTWDELDSYLPNENFDLETKAHIAASLAYYANPATKYTNQDSKVYNTPLNEVQADDEVIDTTSEPDGTETIIKFECGLKLSLSAAQPGNHKLDYRTSPIPTAPVDINVSVEEVNGQLRTVTTIISPSVDAATAVQLINDSIYFNATLVAGSGDHLDFVAAVEA